MHLITVVCLTALSVTYSSQVAALRHQKRQSADDNAGNICCLPKSAWAIEEILHSGGTYIDSDGEEKAYEDVSML